MPACGRMAPKGRSRRQMAKWVENSAVQAPILISILSFFLARSEGSITGDHGGSARVVIVPSQREARMLESQ